MRERSCGSLLTAAVFFDLLMLLVLSILAAPLVQGPLPDTVLPETPSPNATVILSGMLLFVLIPVFWLITEVLLGGWSPGRALLRLELCEPDGKPLGKVKRTKRALRKLGTLGLSGVNPARSGGYDRAVGAVWHSPIAPRKARPASQWTLKFLSGSRKGTQSSLAKLPGLRERGMTRLGRDKRWADVPLSSDNKVSGQHAILLWRGKKLHLRDGNGTSGSTHGTFVNGRRLANGETVALDTATEIQLADIRIAILR